MDKNPERDIEKELDETSFRSYAVYVGGKLLVHGFDLNKLTDIAADMLLPCPFDKFYRADTSDAAISGTGLCMSIVKNYVEAHGGKVWVESELGKGTVVKFVLQI